MSSSCSCTVRERRGRGGPQRQPRRAEGHPGEEPADRLRDPLAAHRGAGPWARCDVPRAGMEPADRDRAEPGAAARGPGSVLRMPSGERGLLRRRDVPLHHGHRAARHRRGAGVRSVAAPRRGGHRGRVRHPAPPGREDRRASGRAGDPPARVDDRHRPLPGHRAEGPRVHPGRVPDAGRGGREGRQAPEHPGERHRPGQHQGTHGARAGGRRGHHGARIPPRPTSRCG